MTTALVPTDDGDREMVSTESDLAYDFPEVAPDVIHSLVRRSYAAMTPAKVHSFLPLLVARDVRAQLRG